MIPGAFPIIAGGAGDASIVWTEADGQFDAGSPQTTFTFTSKAIGDEGASRRIVVGIIALSSTDRTVTVTVGGNSASEVSACHSADGSSIVSMFVLDSPDDPGGTTATIVGTVSGAAINGFHIGIWAVYGALSATARDTATDTGEPCDVSLDVLPGGVIAAICLKNALVDWTGVTEDFDTIYDGQRITGGHYNAVSGETPRTVTVEFTSSAATNGNACALSLR